MNVSKINVIPPETTTEEGGYREPPSLTEAPMRVELDTHDGGKIIEKAQKQAQALGLAFAAKPRTLWQWFISDPRHLEVSGDRVALLRWMVANGVSVTPLVSAGEASRPAHLAAAQGANLLLDDGLPSAAALRQAMPELATQAREQVESERREYYRPLRRELTGLLLEHATRAAQEGQLDEPIELSRFEHPPLTPRDAKKHNLYRDTALVHNNKENAAWWNAELNGDAQVEGSGQNRVVIRDLKRNGTIGGVAMQPLFAIHDAVVATAREAAEPHVATVMQQMGTALRQHAATAGLSTRLEFHLPAFDQQAHRDVSPKSFYKALTGLLASRLKEKGYAIAAGYFESTVYITAR